MTSFKPSPFSPLLLRNHVRCSPIDTTNIKECIYFLNSVDINVAILYQYIYFKIYGILPRYLCKNYDIVDTYKL